MLTYAAHLKTVVRGNHYGAGPVWEGCIPEGNAISAAVQSLAFPNRQKDRDPKNAMASAACADEPRPLFTRDHFRSHVQNKCGLSQYGLFSPTGFKRRSCAMCSKYHFEQIGHSVQGVRGESAFGVRIRIRTICCNRFWVLFFTATR